MTSSSDSGEGGAQVQGDGGSNPLDGVAEDGGKENNQSGDAKKKKRRRRPKKAGGGESEATPLLGNGH